jgi:hypothetical protein
MKRLSVFATLIATLLVGPYLSAVTYIMGYPPAGGATIIQSGSSIGPTGGTFSYSSFNSAAYVTLYYGVNFVANVAQSDNLSPGNMIFNGYNPATGIISFVSTQPWVFTSGLTGMPVSTMTQLVVQIQPYTGMNAGFLGSGFLTGETTTKGALGVSGGSGDPLFQVVSAAPYQTTFEFQTWDGGSGIGTGVDVADFYANNNGGSNATVMNTSIDFEFWWNVKQTTAKTVQVGTCKTNLPYYGSIMSAVTAVPAGATVDICPGTYNEQITITQPISLVGLTSGTNASVLLTVPHAGLSQNGTGPVSSFPIFAQILAQDVGPVNISGLTIDGSSSSCPSGASAGVVFLSAANPASGKVINSVIRNTASACGAPQAAAIYGENGSGFASTITVSGNSIHSINGQGIVLGPNQSGSVTANTINQAAGGLALQNSGPNVKATNNNISSTQNAISLNAVTGAIVQSNTVTNTSNRAISLNNNSGGGSNNVTKNTISEGACGISINNAASSDVFLPNNVYNVSSTTCP